MLRIEGLSRRYGRHRVLDGVDLDVPAGKVACIVGPSGCGKSTLLRLVAGLDRPDEGTIHVDERLLSRPGWALEPQERRLNMVFQDYALWPHLSVERIVGYGLNRMDRSERAARVAGLLERLRIAPLARRLPSQLSGGQQQRVAIARALATEPDILLLDEPLSNLDVQLRLEMRKEFGTLFREIGHTVLYVTHDPLEAASFADILVTMKDGAIEQSGSPEELFAAPRSEWLATLAGFDTRLPAEVEQRDGDSTRIRVAGQTLDLAPTAARAIGGARHIVLMLASESVRLGPARPDEAGSLVGTVTHCLFEGRSWRVVADVGGNGVSASSDRRVPLGEAVSLRWDQRAALAFPA